MSMNEGISLRLDHAALLVMDYQEIICTALPNGEKLLARTASLLSCARRAGAKIIYVKVAFRPGYPEASRANKAFSTLKNSGRFIEGSNGTDIHSQVYPQPEDIVVVKRRVSAFTGSDLDLILRSNNIDTLLLAGISTSGVVLSTLREAADKDYKLVVVEDACADTDMDVHNCLMQKIFPRQADVLNAEKLTALFSGAQEIHPSGGNI